MRHILLLALASAAAMLPGQSVENVSTLQRARAVWFGEGENPIEAEVGISFEARPWDEAAKSAWTAGPGTRLALAGTAWAEFATFTDLQFGAVQVKKGSYYAVIERAKDGMVLGLLDATKVRAKQLEPGTGKGQPMVAAIPLVGQDGPDGPLRVEFVPHASGATVTLQVRWGPHALAATAGVEAGKGAMPVAMPDPRQGSRVSWARKDGRLPMAIVDHGVLPWNDEMKVHAEALQIGERWRLGKDWATTLDTNTPLVIGGKKLAPGLWHLTMEKSKVGWSLAISSAAEDYAAKLDAFAANQVRPIVVVPLQEDTERIKTADLLVLFQQLDQQLRLVVSAPGEQFFVPIELRT